jgi:hypothetical protein
MLQLRFAAPFYDKVPGAVFLQFPWRLLAIVTPSLIVAAVFLADRVLPRDPRMFGLGAAAAWMVVACGAFAPLQDPRVPLEPRLAALSFSGFREYEPKSAAPLGEVQTRLAARWADAGCFLERHTQEEASVVVLRTSCGRAAVLPLPIYASPLHSVRTSLHDRQQRCLTMPEFPALCVAAIPAATAEVMVILPRMGRIPQWVWQRLTRASN